MRKRKKKMKRRQSRKRWWTRRRKAKRRWYLQLPHLVELHPEVRHVPPELQEIDLERSRPSIRWGCVALGTQNWGAT